MALAENTTKICVQKKVVVLELVVGMVVVMVVVKEMVK